MKGFTPTTLIHILQTWSICLFSFPLHPCLALSMTLGTVIGSCEHLLNSFRPDYLKRQWSRKQSYCLQMNLFICTWRKVPTDILALIVHCMPLWFMMSNIEGFPLLGSIRSLSAPVWVDSYHHDAHFTDEDSDVSWLSKVTEPAGDRARIWALAIWLATQAAWLHMQFCRTHSWERILGFGW